MRKLALISIMSLLTGLFACGPSKTAKKQDAEVKKTKTPAISTRMAEESASVPSWYEKAPKTASHYYFAGVGKGKSEKGAKEAALADIFSQIVYMVNASVTSNSSFEKYVEESGDQARKSSAVYSKVRAKGDAIIEQFEVEEQKVGSEETRDGVQKVTFLLAKIPKGEIEKSRQRSEAEKAERRKNPMGVFAVAVFPNNNVEEVDSIKGELENLYKEMGFNISIVDADFTADDFKNAGRTVNALKKGAPGIKKALLCVIKPTNIRKENLRGTTVTSILGDMVIREIDVTTGEIVASNTYKGKGVSMRSGADAAEDAFRKLIKSLTDDLLGANEASVKDSSF